MVSAQEFPSEVLLSIQEAANFLKVNPMTLRRWETRGLLIPQRTAGNQRRYTFSQLLEFKKRKYSRNAAYQRTDVSETVDSSIVNTALPNVVLESTRGKTLYVYQKGSDFSFFFKTLSRFEKIAGGAVLGGIVIGAFFFLLQTLNISLLAELQKFGLPFFNNLTMKQSNNDSSAVLAEQTLSPSYLFRVRIPSQFDGVATFKDNIILGGKKLEAGTISALELTAGNVIYSIKAGDGISVGSGQNPTITNSGVLSVGGKTGAVTLTAGTGITIDGNKITNSLPEANQNLWKTFTVGSTSLNAGSTTDTFTFAAGTGIALALDTTNKKLTVTGTADPGFSDDGTVVRLSTITDNVGLGTTSPLARLDVRGNSGTTPAASISAQSSFAALVLDNKGAGDLFTASSSGLNRFVITQNGNVGIGTNTPSNTLYVAGTGVTIAPTVGTGTSLLVKAVSGVTGNILDIQNNAGTTSYFNINSSGQLSGSAFKLSDINNAIVGTAIEGGWTMNSNTYTFRRVITVANNDSSTTLPINYEITVSLSGSDASQVYNASQSNYKDVRMAYGSTEIAMNITTFTSSSVVFTFLTQAAIAASSSDATYYLYYRNTSLATSGSTYTSGSINIDTSNNVSNWTTSNAVTFPIAQESTIKPAGDTQSIKIGATAADATVANVGTWSSFTIPNAYINVNLGTATINGTTYIYIVGGSSSSTIYKATLDSSGNPGTFSSTGYTFAGTSNIFTVFAKTISGTSYLYAIDGISAYRATLDANGNITSNFSTTGQGQLNNSSYRRILVVDIGSTTYLYALGGTTTANSSYKSSLDTSGNINSWTTEGATPVAITFTTDDSQGDNQIVQGQIGNNYFLYFVTNVTGQQFYKASINTSTGELGSWSQGGDGIPSGLTDAPATSYDGMYFYTFSSVYSNTVIRRVQLNNSGNPVSWTTTNQTPLPALGCCGAIRNLIPVIASVNGTSYIYTIMYNTTTLVKSPISASNYTTTETISSTDLSTKGGLQFKTYSSTANPHLVFEFSEDGTTWQSYPFNVTATSTWETKIWDISGIPTTSRDAVTKIRLRSNDPASAFTDYYADFQEIQTAFTGTAPSATFTNGIYGAANLAVNAQGTGAVRVNYTTSQPNAGSGGLELYDGLGGLVFNVSGGGNASASGTLSFTGASSSASLNLLSGQNLAFKSSAGGDAGLGTIMTLTNNGKLGLGIASPVSLFDLSGAVTGKSLFNLNYTGTGQNIFTASSSGSTKFLIDSGGNVGIGTTSLLATLDIRGTLGTIPTASLSANSSFAALVVDNKGAGDLFTASSSGLNRFVVKQNGNVGVGVNIPQLRLDVQDAQAATAAAQIFNTSTNADADGLVIKLGNTSTTVVATTNHFLSFETSGIGIVGSIQGNGGTGIQLAQNGIADFAEYLPKDNSTDIPFGSLVCVGSDGKVDACVDEAHLRGLPQAQHDLGGGNEGGSDTSVHLSSGRTIVGAASEHPFLLGGNNLGDGSIAVGFVGQVKTLVSTESGEIKPGDMITVSSTPGVGKKAVEKGFVVGRALEPYSCHSELDSESIWIADQVRNDNGDNDKCQGKILVLVSPTWYDPTISLTADGILASQGEALQARATASNAVDTKKSASADLCGLTRFVDNNEPNLRTRTSITACEQFVKSLFQTPVSLLGVDPTGIEPVRPEFLGPAPEPGGPTPLILSQLLADIVNNQATSNVAVASLSARLSILESITTSTSSTSFTSVIASLGEAIPFSEIASSSATPRNDAAINSATISGSLMVLGRTTLSDLGVTGNITAGLMTIKGMDLSICHPELVSGSNEMLNQVQHDNKDCGFTSLNTLGDLYLQNNLLGGINMMAGKITIDTKGNIVTTGNITAKTVTLEKINFITQAPLIISDTEIIATGSAGTVILKNSNTYLKIDNQQITTNSAVLLTPKTPLNGNNLYIKEQQAGDHFTIGVEQPMDKDVEVNYLIVN